MTRSPDPPRGQLLDAIEAAVTRLSGMIGRWFDHLPAEARAEAHAIREPLQALLARAGRLGPDGTPAPRTRRRRGSPTE
jgi:hypothetical protein